jgi:hypothetical protein
MDVNDIASKRKRMISEAHLSKLIELGLAEMREGVPYLNIAGQNTVGKHRRYRPSLPFEVPFKCH